MNVASTQYSLKYKSFEIYLSGCEGSCEGCCNPELKDFNVGQKLDKYVLNYLIAKIMEFDNLIDKIWVLGGDPLDNDKVLLQFLLMMLRITTNKEIWLWTRYDLGEIPEDIKRECDYIKCGEYKPKLKCEANIQYGVKLETSNQIIYKRGVDYDIKS